MENDDKLINDLISRINVQIKLQKNINSTGYQTQDQIQQDHIRKLNEETLIHLSSNKLNIIASGLSDSLEGLIKRKDKDETNEHNSWAQSYILNLLAKCMAHQWYHIKSQFRNVQGLDEKEAIRLKEKEEQILPPPLEENLAKLILYQAVTCLMRALVNNEVDMEVNSGKVIFQLSATNYETVSGKIAEILHVIVNGKGEADEQFTNQFFLIEHLNLNSKRLSELLDKITKSATHFKKERHQFVLSQVLRKAVWNWIDNYPMEFVTLCKMCERLPGQPDVLFDVLDGWAKKTAHKNSFWPLQTMLLILCPDIMLAIHKNEKSADTAKKESFLDALRKSLKVPKLADVAAVCYVDICKASTFVSKSEMSALRYIVPVIETELKERLFNLTRTPDVGPNDIELMTDCLVSFFKISPRKILTLIPENLTDVPQHFKMVLVKSLLRIAQEDSANTLPWSPSIADAYSLVNVQLKQLFNDFLQSIRSYASLKTASDKKSKAQLEKVQFDTQVMSLLIQLFLADPNLSLYTSVKSVAQNLEDIRNIITGLCYCSSQFHLPEISDVAAETLLKFHNPVYIDSWYEKKMINGFWEISSAVNVSLANALIEQKESKAGQVQKLITLLEEILIRRNAFLDKSKDTLRPEASVRDVRLQGSTKLEVALLIHLCSPEPDICSKCATCFGLLCEEIEILGDTSDEANSIVTNYAIYKKLSTAGILQTGRQHQQKVIRSLLRRIEAQTPGNFAAWEEVYQRWQALTPVLVQHEENERNKKPNSAVFNSSGSSSKTQAFSDKTAAEVKQEWHNSLGFLCSMSGVTLNKETTVRVTNDKLRVQKKQERTIKVIASFLDEVAELMVNESAFMRESAVLLVGTGLSPAAYAWLFRVLQEELQSYFGDAGQLIEMSERCTLFVEQTISVVKHVLDISQEAEDLSIITSFENLMLLIIKYINHLVTTASMRIKKNFCALLDVMMAKRHYISFSKEMEFRNSILENIVEWTSDFGMTPSSTTSEMLARIDQTDNQSKNDLTKKLVKEVDIACITTIASLLRGLELPTTDAGVNMFKKYFTFFTTLLTRCKQDAAEGSTALADGAIKSLSNMLSANIHYEYFVMMGYHEDHETRAAFLRVIANILNQGTGFDAVTDEPEEKYEKFVDLLLEPDFYALLAFIEVIPITDCDELAPILVNFLEHNDRTMVVLKKVIHHEVVNTESANSLLRRNSMATKMLGAFTKHIGRPYLKLALYPVINQLINQKESMEIDPSRLGPNEDAAVNATRLISLTKQFITAIQDSLPHLPIALREISAHISKVVAEAFPGNEKMAIGAIGGIMFLRFICPAILNPDFYGIVSAGILTQDTRRALTLCVKLLQNMANGQLGVRESFMSSCNSFVAENMKTMEELLESFAVISPDLPAASKSAVIDSWSWEAREEDTIIMHRHVVHNLEKITNLLSGQMNQKGVADHLTQVLQRLGPPPSLERKKNTPGTRTAIGAGIGAAAKSGNHYEDFMRRHENTNIELLKQKKIFYKQGMTKDKLPLFYYIARRYEASFDMEQLLYLILKTCKDSMRAPFSMVIDCTLITGEHNIPMSWCSTWMRHFPQQLTDNLKTLYIVSPNHILKKFMKRVTKLIGRAAKKIVFVSNPVRLFDHIVEAEHGLPATTLAMETDVKATFSPVVKLSGQYHEKSITLRVTNDTIQMISLKLYPILSKPTPLVDIYHISSIHEIDITNINDDDQEFYIKYESNGPKSMTFRSPQRAQIIQAVVQCVARWKLSKPENKVSNRVFRPQDIPGTLLNVALLNLGSTRNALRVAAYNMLSALCRNSNFSINMQLLETNGLCIPKNISQFIIRISEKLSKTQTPLTLEFLQESLHGFTKASAIAKHLVLDYIEPWIPNLALFCQRPSSEHLERYKKTINVINQLIDLSIKEVSMKSVILAKIWTTFGRQKESLILLVLKCLVKKCQDAGFGHPNSEVICEMVSSIGSVASQLVAGKLIARVIRILERTSEAPHVSELSEHRLWPRLTVYLRLLLHLSFDNSICAHLYLSDLLHIICTLFSVGNIYVRISVHALLINTVHSLYTYLVPNCSKLTTVPFLLSEFGQPSLRLLFGINNSNISAADSPPQNDNAKDLERMSITNVDPVVNAIFGLLNVFKDNIEQGKVWHSRWLSLTTLAALRSNPPVQSRALITLGIIARSSQQSIKDELIFDILCVLRNAANSPRALQDYADLIVGALQCLTRLFEYLSPSSCFIPSLFWIATTLVQLYDSRIFPAAIALLETILKTMDRRDLFTDSVSNTMMLAREPHAAILSKLDNITGISFESNFGFAITSHLLKGLKYASTKTATSRLLSTFLNISTKKSSGASILAYLGALLTTEGEVANIDQITLLAGESSRTAPTQLLFNEHMIPDPDHAALLFTLLVTILSHSDREHEQLFIYEALKEGIQFMPQSFPVMYRTLIPKISTVISSSQIEKMIQACLSIMVHMFSFQMESPTNTNKLSLAHLKKIRFQGLPDCGAGFYRQSTHINESILKACSELLESMCKEIEDQNSKDDQDVDSEEEPTNNEIVDDDLDDFSDELVFN